MDILKNHQLSDLIHDHVDLDVHLDPLDRLERLQNHKIELKHSLLVIMGILMTKCSCIVEMTSKLSKNPKFRFYLKNWPINMCDVLGCPMV